MLRYPFYHQSNPFPLWGTSGVNRSLSPPGVGGLRVRGLRVRGLRVIGLRVIGLRVVAYPKRVGYATHEIVLDNKIDYLRQLLFFSRKKHVESQNAHFFVTGSKKKTKYKPEPLKKV